jgi:hypothetical protein
MPKPDEDFIGIGDVVEHKMNTNVFGIVIGFAGSVVYLRLSPRLRVASFHEWELRLLDDDGGPEPDEPARADNVVPVDFTRGVKLTKNTKTKGAA